jgi:signal transduction histidine kinase
MPKDFLEQLDCTPAVWKASLDGSDQHFNQLRNGVSVWRFVADSEAVWVPEALSYHHAHRHNTVWDVPFKVEGRVAGYIALAFRTLEKPREVAAETVGALSQQVALAMELNALSGRLREAEVREAVLGERSRLARDIHDSLAQCFSSISMQTDVLLSRDGQSDWVLNTLRRIADTARFGLAEARTTALALLPLENRVRALDEALEGLCERASVRGALVCTFSSEGPPRILPFEVQDTVLRVCQEAMSNALRHSGANNLWVRLEYTLGEVLFQARDDGAGFGNERASAFGMGIRGMRERTEQLRGSFDVQTVPGAGTTISIAIPTRLESHGDSD